MRRGIGAWAAAVLLVAVVTVPATRAAAASEFEPPPSPPALNGVACTSDTHCFAVGERYVGRHGRTLIKRWTGTRWALSVTPNPPGKVDVELIGVSCFSPTSCFAVGSYGTSKWARTLVLYWDGAKWSIKNSPNPPGQVQAQLSRITCATGAGCIAVGTYGTATWARTLVERWNGSRWSIMRSPNPPGRTLAQLTGIACPAPTNCVAVGSYGTERWERTLVERWNGTTWSIQSSPNPSSSQHLAAFLDVACPAADNCDAVGYVDLERTLTQHWDGTRWRIVPSPTPAGHNDLLGLFSVSCPSATDCFTVGVALQLLIDDPNFTGRPLVERWNGTTWSIVQSPKLSLPALLSVTCVSTTSCYAVGFQGGGALQEHWDGAHWTVQT